MNSGRSSGEQGEVASELSGGPIPQQPHPAICPGCGSPNAAGGRFCAKCGAPLAALADTELPGRAVAVGFGEREALKPPLGIIGVVVVWFVSVPFSAGGLFIFLYSLVILSRSLKNLDGGALLEGLYGGLAGSVFFYICVRHLYKTTSNYVRHRAAASAERARAASGDATAVGSDFEHVLCLACGRPMPEGTVECAACGWSFDPGGFEVEDLQAEPDAAADRRPFV